MFLPSALNGPKFRSTSGLEYGFRAEKEQVSEGIGARHYANNQQNRENKDSLQVENGKKNGTLKAPFYIRYRQSFMFQE